MHHDPLHPWRLHLRGSLHVVQGWLLRDRQRILQGRYERLLGEIGQVHLRVQGGVGRAEAPASVQQQLVA